MTRKRIQVDGARVLVMGLIFKENCPDLRNMRVIDIVRESKNFNVDVDVYDPWVDPAEAGREFGVTPVAVPTVGACDAIILAVAHWEFCEMGAERIRALGPPAQMLYDLKYILPAVESDIRL